VKHKILLGFFLVACLLITFAIIPTPVSADDLLQTDFQKESFAKTVDYFDYVRALNTLHGLPKPSTLWHAYVYMTYVNKMGLKMLYAGLCNISLADIAYLTIPMQTLLLHYKTENNSRDALVASSFLMIMGFNDTANSIYPSSPDRNDTLWASFSLGVNLPNDLPALNSKCEVYQLTHSADKLTWKWGMKYTNLTALWTTALINGETETNTTRPWGLVTYDELTFNYTLTIDPETNKATISQDYVIGRMRNLWIFLGWIIVPIYQHYNSTGCYWLGNKISNKTIYEFLHECSVKMSIVNFQTSVMLDRNTYSASAGGQNVTDNEVYVGNSSISTYADDGEKIFDAGFGVKETYNLFNYTEDSTENTPHTYNAVARTSQISGYARNRNLFRYHRDFAKYLPLILMHMYPTLAQNANHVQKVKDRIANMTRADYLYVISYPNYSGYRVEHDPVYTVYFAPTTLTAPNLGALIAFAAILGVIIVAAVVIVKRKSTKKSPETQTQPSPPPPPSTF